MTERVKMGKVNLKQRRMTAGAGMLGPALFVGVFTLEGWLRPGYAPKAMYISALSLGPRGRQRPCWFLPLSRSRRRCCNLFGLDWADSTGCAGAFYGVGVSFWVVFA